MRRWFHLLWHRIRRLVMRHRAQRAQRAYRNLRAARMETLRGLRVKTHFNARPAPFLLTKSAGGTLRLCTSLMPATPQATVSSDDAPPSTLPYDDAGGDGASAGPVSGGLWFHASLNQWLPHPPNEDNVPWRPDPRYIEHGLDFITPGPDTPDTPDTGSTIPL